MFTFTFRYWQSQCLPSKNFLKSAWFHESHILGFILASSRFTVLIVNHPIVSIASQYKVIVYIWVSLYIYIYTHLFLHNSVKSFRGFPTHPQLICFIWHIKLYLFLKTRYIHYFLLRTGSTVKKNRCPFFPIPNSSPWYFQCFMMFTYYYSKKIDFQYLSRVFPVKRSISSCFFRVFSIERSISIKISRFFSLPIPQRHPDPQPPRRRCSVWAPWNAPFHAATAPGHRWSCCWASRRPQRRPTAQPAGRRSWRCRRSWEGHFAAFGICPYIIIINHQTIIYNHH